MTIKAHQLLQAASTLALALGIVSFRYQIAAIFTGHPLRIALLVIALVNRKNLPFIWHWRVLNGVFMHTKRPRNFTPATACLDGPWPALFQATVTESRTPPTECDYNMHKSNSTYFSDLDVTRTHLISCLLHQGIGKLQDKPGSVVDPNGVRAKGNWFIAIGAVHCSFKREIKPFEKFEMWTRLLCWDRKWMFVITHFVKAGSVRPEGYTLEDGTSILKKLMGKKAKTGRRKDMSGEKSDLSPDTSALEPKLPHKAIFASAITKYVMKVGRLTIHPEVAMEASGLLPPKPGGWNTMSAAKSSTSGTASPKETYGSVAWDWQSIEAENARGMKIAQQFANLDDLHNEFTGDDKAVLGRYNDFFC